MQFLFIFFSDLWILEVRERLSTISGAKVLRKAHKLLCSKAGAEYQKITDTRKMPLRINMPRLRLNDEIIDWFLPSNISPWSWDKKMAQIGEKLYSLAEERECFVLFYFACHLHECCINEHVGTRLNMSTFLLIWDDRYGINIIY